MTYIPQTRWIESAKPEPENPRSTRKLSKSNVINLLTAKQWLTSGQIAAELGSTVESAKSADRTLRRMAQCGAIQRRRHAEGMFVFGLMA